MSIPRLKIPQKLRNQIIARSDHLCQFCGSHETSIFEIHHIDEDIIFIENFYLNPIRMQLPL